VAILLTGVGYIGATLLRQIVARAADGGARERIVAIDDFSSTAREQVVAALPPNVQLVEGDVADPSVVARAFELLSGPTPGGQSLSTQTHSGQTHSAHTPSGPTPSRPTQGPHTDTAHNERERLVVFHLAAQPSASVAAREPALTERSNLTGARVLLYAAHEHGATVVFGGSFRVYGDDLVGRTIDEDAPYGRVGDLSHLSKVYVEQLARMIGVPFVSVRLGVTYGLSPIMKTAPAFMTVPNLFCKRACAGEGLQVLEDRPMAFIHVDDAAAALLEAAEVLDKREAAAWRAVNAAPEVATIGQLARTVQLLAHRRGNAVAITGKAASEASFRVRSSLGSTPGHTLDNDLDAVLDYFEGRQEQP
jgi:nucleoside-diphosphate-sugar epimerase